MSLYGNILTLYSSSNAQLKEVRTILENNITRFEQIEATFFLETTSKNNTRAVIKDITLLNVDFTFYHIHHPDGDELRAGGIDPAIVDRLRQLLFE